MRFPGNDPQGAENETVVRKWGGPQAADALAEPVQRTFGKTSQRCVTAAFDHRITTPRPTVSMGWRCVRLLRFKGFHVDNGNNSLIPPTHDRRNGQISSWYFPDAVDETQAPMLIVPKAIAAGTASAQPDRASAIALTVPANTLMIFNTVLWHSSSMYQGDEGQRYTLTRIYGRADHPWVRLEIVLRLSPTPTKSNLHRFLFVVTSNDCNVQEGVGSYTNRGSDPHWRQFIAGLSARQREYFFNDSSII
eukprot:SAG31_NODE_7671_length_1622_cov_1.094550_2_plen_249_part_00